MSDQFHFNLADESPLEWGSPEEGISPEQQASRAAFRWDDDPDIVLEPSAPSAAPNSRSSLQSQTTPPETPAEEQNGGIPALQAVCSAFISYDRQTS
jgi:hypothetical protein